MARRPLTREFRLLWYGTTVTNLGDGLRLAALPLLAVSLTDSPFLIAGVTAASFLPWLFFAPFGGAFVDRWRRRETVITNQLVRAVLMGVLALLVFSGRVEIWHVYATALLITMGEILVDPAVTAMVPLVVEPDDLDDANGRIAATEIVTNEFAGAPLGGVMFAVRSWLPFAIDGCTYAASVIAFRRLPRTASRPATDEVSTVRADIVEGVRWLRAHPVLGPMAYGMALFNVGAAAAWSMLVLLVTDEMDAPDVSFGFLLAAAAAGAFLGSLVAARAAERFGRFAIIIGGVAWEAAVLVAVGQAPNVPVLFGLWFLVGLPPGMWMPIARALQQRLTPTRLFGRVNTGTRVLTRGAFVVGAMASGVVASALSVRATISLGGVIQIIAAMVLWAALRGQDLDGAPAGDDIRV